MAERWGHETEEFEHERLRAQAARAMEKTSSLTNSRNYYEVMAADKSLPKSERDLWQQLADEISHRLGDRRPPAPPPEPLWSD